MYGNARSRVKIDESVNEECCINVSVHQGSILGPLLFVLSLASVVDEVRNRVTDLKEIVGIVILNFLSEFAVVLKED